MPRGQFFVLLREIAPREAEQLEMALLASSFPDMTESGRRQVLSGLRQGMDQPEVIASDDQQRAAITEFRRQAEATRKKTEAL